MNCKSIGILVMCLTVYSCYADYACWRGDRAYKQNNFMQAKYWYEKALGERPENTKALYCWAKAAYKQKDFIAAEQAFEKVLQDTTLSTVQKEQALSSLGDTAVQKADYQKAVDKYTQALELNPTSEYLKKRLAQARLLLEQQKQKQQSASDQKRDTQADTTRDTITNNNQGNQNGQQQNTSSNKSESTEKQSADQKHGAQQGQQADKSAIKNSDTQDTNQDSNNTKQQQQRQNTDANHNAYSPDKQALPSQYRQKNGLEQEQACCAKINNKNSNLSKQQQQVLEAIAQEDQQALTRLLAGSVYKDQQDNYGDKNW